MQILQHILSTIASDGTLLPLLQHDPCGFADRLGLDGKATAAL
jgi:hypothetical protein